MYVCVCACVCALHCEIRSEVNCFFLLQDRTLFCPRWGLRDGNSTESLGSSTSTTGISAKLERQNWLYASVELVVSSKDYVVL